MDQRKDLRLRGLIDHLYDSVGKQNTWSFVAQRIAEAFDSTSVAINLKDNSGCLQQLGVSNETEIRCALANTGEISVEDYLELEINSLLEPQDLLGKLKNKSIDTLYEGLIQVGRSHSLETIFPITPHLQGVLGIHRSVLVNDYDDEDRRRVSVLVPHLQRSLKIHHRLSGAECTENLLKEVFAHLTAGIAIVDSQAKILYLNKIAEKMLDELFPLQRIDGMLTPRDRKFRTALSTLIQGAAGLDKSLQIPLMNLPRHARMPVLLTASLLSPRWNPLFGSQPSVIVYISDPESPVACRDALRKLYSLTPREAAIAEILSTGKTLEEIGRLNGIGIGTVRTHLKKILAKTGTTRQSQLVALVLRCAPSFTLALHQYR